MKEVREHLGGDRRGAGERPQPEALLHALLAAFPDRVARRRDSSTGKGVMVGGRGVRMAPQSAVSNAEFFVCVDVDVGQTEALVRQASAIERAWLPSRGLRTADEVFFHPTQKSVVGRRRTYWDDLVLDEVNIPAPAGEETARLLAEAAARDWDRVFPTDDAVVNSFLARVRCLADWMPELKLPTFDEAELQSVLLELCQTRRYIRRTAEGAVARHVAIKAELAAAGSGRARSAGATRRPQRQSHRAHLRGGPSPGAGRPHTGGFWTPPNAASGRRARSSRAAPAGSQYADAANHRRFGKFLGQRLPTRPQRSAGPLPQAPVARRSLDGRTDATDKKAAEA